MIITALNGGMGNQMFQYALGRHLSIRRNDTLFLSTLFFSSAMSKRRYGLDHFNVKGTVSNDVEAIRHSALLWTVRQVDFRFHSSIFDTSVPNLMIDGFWQSEKYFSDVSDIIRADFAFKAPLPQQYSALVASMEAESSVCLHVRRDDYLDRGDNKGFIGNEYYRRSCEYIASQIDNPHFYIFSDEIDWCRENLHIPYKRTLIQPESSAVDHLQLMTRCKYFVIANSTFSWWGAWLGRCPTKLVVAPRRWFRREMSWDPTAALFLSSHDLIPKEWVRI
jgi:hypothetical protein